MLKYFCGFVVLLAVSLFVSVKYEQYTHEPAPKSQSGSGAPVAPSDAEVAANQAEKAERDHPCWYFAYQTFGWPNGVTVWALFLTMLVIADQTRHTARAAKATEDAVSATKRSIEVQEAEFVQWIDIGDWSIEYDRSEYQLARAGHQIANHPGEMKVRLSFPLFNNTTRPLFIKSVRTLLTIGAEKVFKNFTTEESLPVPPKDEYKVIIDTILNEAQVTGYIAYTLLIEATVEVNFSNALQKPAFAAFQRLVACRAFEDTQTMSKGHVSK